MPIALDAERSEGKTPYDAILSGVLDSVSSILMTTIGRLARALPLMLGTAWAPNCDDR